jgi:hypothetical protein
MRLVDSGRLAPAPIEHYAQKTRARLNAALDKLVRQIDDASADLDPLGFEKRFNEFINPEGNK